MKEIANIAGERAFVGCSDLVEVVVDVDAR